MKTLLASIGITLIVLGFYMNLRGEEGSSEKKQVAGFSPLDLYLSWRQVFGTVLPFNFVA